MKSISPRAQTDRTRDARPASALLGGWGLTGRILQWDSRSVRRRATSLGLHQIAPLRVDGLPFIGQGEKGMHGC